MHFTPRTGMSTNYMKTIPVEYRPEALSDIESIFRFVVEKSCDVVTAMRFTDRIFARCEKIGNVPHGGVTRDDLGTGIQLIPFEKTAVILYKVEEDVVWITNIFYGGRDYDVLMNAQGYSS